MTAVKWHEGRMAALDFESTGTDPQQDRAVTAALVHATPGEHPRYINWVIDPGIDIPTEASDIHGWTTERVKDFLQGHEAARTIIGQGPRFLTRAGAIAEIGNQVATVMHAQAPLIIFNAAYDLTLLESELDRHDLPTLASRPDGIRGVVDPMVLDKAYDTYRKTCYKAPGCDHQAGVVNCTGCRGGKHRCGGCGAPDRKLGSLCQHYGVTLTNAHDAAADCLAAGQLTMALVRAWPLIGTRRLSTLHDQQVVWRKEQADGLRAYFDRNGTEHDGVDPGWPVYSSWSSAKAVA